MILLGFSGFEWLVLIQHELLLFAGIFFLIGMIDELAMDAAWLWYRVTGRSSTTRLSPRQAQEYDLGGVAAVFIATWRESAVIGATVRHALEAWPHPDLRLYIGCYRNDSETMEAVIAAAHGDPRLRLVIHHRDGPTTKADCLNRLYQALEMDEARSGVAARMVMLHDAEDMVDPCALTVMDRAMEDNELVQVPVMALPQENSRWVGSHYTEEFAEAHGKSMVVRDALNAGLPLAGVGCAISRRILGRIAREEGNRPFAADCLTEDYVLGLRVAQMGARSRFLRMRAPDGQLIATRAYFPSTLVTAVRQKTRWIHGIAFQGWDELGWSARPAELWMRLRDRRGPFSALVLAAAYMLLFLSAMGLAISASGLGPTLEVSDTLKWIMILNFAGFAWRSLSRFAFTAREFGLAEGARAMLRIPVANIIAIMAGRRALFSYLASFMGKMPSWDKTEHSQHPAMMVMQKSAG